MIDWFQGQELFEYEFETEYDMYLADCNKELKAPKSWRLINEIDQFIFSFIARYMKLTLNNSFCVEYIIWIDLRFSKMGHKKQIDNV